MALHHSSLTVKPRWLALLLSGRKTWELRSCRCHLRGDVALMASGCATVYGIVEPLGCVFGSSFGPGVDDRRGENM